MAVGIDRDRRQVEGDRERAPSCAIAALACSAQRSENTASCISSVSLAPCRMTAAEIGPWNGWRARANISTPTIWRSRRSIFGWYQNSIHPARRACAKSM